MLRELHEKTLEQLRVYFGCKDRPVTLSEFTKFWISLDAPQKAYYKTARFY